ncbi:MAG: extracellular solute-binding protein [Actinomycetota bacterium]
MTKRTLFLMLIALAGAFALAGCGDDSDEQTIRIYTGRHYDLEEAFELFAEERGISIEYLEGSDADLRERIAAEGEDTQADIYMTVDAGNLAKAAEQGIFAPLDSEILESAVPSNLRDPDGYWFALSQRARTIVYSPDRVSADELPTTYEELAQPEWAGRICLRNSTNTYTQSLVASLIGNVGYDEALGIVSGWADNADILPNDVIALNTIAEGGCDVAIVNHYYLARLMEDEPDFPVELVWADQAGRGTHVNISGAGVTKFADDPELAQELLEWLATDGQSSFVDGNHEYPVNPDVSPEALIATEFGETFLGDDLNAAEFGALNADAVRLLDEAGYE